MKKKTTFFRFLLVLAIMIAVVFYLPTEKKTVTPEQKEELTVYIGQINELNHERARILHVYDTSVIGAEKVTDAYRTLEEDIVPMFASYQTRAKKLQLKETDIQAVHALYLTATTTQQTTFEAYVKAYRTQQEEVFEQANETLKESNQQYQAFDKALRELAKRYELTLPNQP